MSDYPLAQWKEHSLEWSQTTVEIVSPHQAEVITKFDSPTSYISFLTIALKLRGTTSGVSCKKGMGTYVC